MDQFTPNIGISKGGGPTIASMSIPALPAGSSALPFNTYDWPNPRGPYYDISLRTCIIPVSLALRQPLSIPPRVTDWGMWLDPRTAMTWVQAPSLSPGPTYVPSRVSDWGTVPPARTLAALTWLQSPNFAQQGLPANNTWPLPPALPRAVQTWLQAPFQGTPFPVNQNSWPLPIRAATQPPTWVQTPPQVPVTGNPVVQTDWPNPIRSVTFLQTWLQSPQTSNIVIAPEPVNQYDWPNPTPRYYPISLRSQTSQPQKPLGLAFLPSRVVDWGRWEDPRVALTWTRSPQPVSVSPIPVNQYDWPNPILRVRQAITWTQAPQAIEWIFRAPLYTPKWGPPPLKYEIPPLNFALLTTPPPPLPPGKSDLRLPLRAVEPAKFWTQSPTFAPPPAVNLIPSRVVDWGTVPAPAPLIQTYPPNIAITAPLPPKPINQTDWPLPTRAITFLQATTQSNILVRAPQVSPCNQYDWPLPTPQRRNALTFTWFNLALYLTPPPPRPPITMALALPILRTPQIYSYTYSEIQFQPLPPPPPPELPNVEAPLIRDWWDRDDWGRFIPGASIR